MTGGLRHGSTRQLQTGTLTPFFEVCHTERTYRLVSGERPGDPLADLIFNACMTGFIRELRKCLIAYGLLVGMQDLDGNPLEQAQAEGGRDQGLSWIWMAPRGYTTTPFPPSLGTPTMQFTTHTIMVTLVRWRHGTGSA